MPPPCVFGCSNFERVHTFPDPNKYPDRFKVWVQLAGLKVDPSEEITIYRKKRVCNNHFTDSHKTRNNRLSAIAVPTLNLKRKVAEPPNNYIPKAITKPPDPKEARVKRLLNVYKDSVRKVAGSPYSSDKNLDLSESGFITIKHVENRVPSPILRVKTCNKVYTKRKGIVHEKKPEAKTDEQMIPVQEQDVKPEEPLDVEKCIICENAITDSNYVCVECAEFNMCETCALRCDHSQHYMLRIPCPKPFVEVKAIIERVQTLIYNLDANQSFKSELTTDTAETDFVMTTAEPTNTSSLQPDDEQFEYDSLGNNTLFEGDIPEPKEDREDITKETILLNDLDKETIEEHYTIDTEQRYTIQNSINYTIVGLDNSVESIEYQEKQETESSGEDVSDGQFVYSKRKYQNEEMATLDRHGMRAVFVKWKKDESSHTINANVAVSEYLSPSR